jgi:hypothetical protein
MERSRFREMYSMNNDKALAYTEKLLVMPYETRWDETGAYSLTAIESLAIETFRKHDTKRTPDDLKDFLDILLWRRVQLLNDNFIWLDEQVKKLIKISDTFMNVFDRAYREALHISKDMENKMRYVNAFVEDYDIEIQLRPYIKEENDDTGITTINGVVAELLSNSIITYTITHHCYEKANEEVPIYLDKSLNWNIEYFGNTFDNYYICYAIHELLDTDKWSFTDILQIDTIQAELKVHQYSFVEKI